MGGGGLTTLQKCSQCILRPQPTGQADFYGDFHLRRNFILPHYLFTFSYFQQSKIAMHGRFTAYLLFTYIMVKIYNFFLAYFFFFFDCNSQLPRFEIMMMSDRFVVEGSTETL